MPQVRTRLLEGAWGYARKENCNFSQCKCSPRGRKGRSKLTGYACLSLDDQRRPQQFVPRDCVAVPTKMELWVKQSSYKGAALAGTIDLGELTVNRLGFGAMRLCGDYAWGRPRDREHVSRVLRRAVELGVNFIDTADSYGPETNELLISQALYPYPQGLVIATKGRSAAAEPRLLLEDGRPDHLRRRLKVACGRLRLERIDLYQLHAPDPNVPFAELVGALADLQRVGKIRHIGISNVTVAQLRTWRAPSRRSCRFRTCTICETRVATTSLPRASVLELLFCLGIPWVENAA